MNDLDQAAMALAEAVRTQRGRFQTVLWWRSHCPESVQKILGVKRVVAKRYDPVFKHAVAKGLLTTVKVGTFETVQPGPKTTIETKPDVLDLFAVAPEAVAPEPEPEPPPPKPVPPPKKAAKKKPTKAKPEPRRPDASNRSVYSALTEARARLIPVPKGSRRTMEKHQQGHGWQGLCVGKDNFYIGGIGNDCRHYQKAKAPWCAVHKALSKRRRIYDDEDE